MGFFAEFNTWLNGILTGYIGDNTARIAGTLEPAIVTLGVIYVMVWGYLQLTGQIEEPFIGGIKKIIVLAVILGCALESLALQRAHRRYVLQCARRAAVR